MEVYLSSLIRPRTEASSSKSLACKLYWSTWRLVVEGVNGWSAEIDG
jgi:hypothetical protein